MKTQNKLISIVSPTYNEAENVQELHAMITEVMKEFLDRYDYELIFIDNASKDGTVDKIRGLMEKDDKVRLIVNTRNFGHIRSPFHGLLQAKGDAVVFIVSDLQDPPAMIADFIKKWEEGYKTVVGVKTRSDESMIMFRIRRAYYRLISRLSEVELINDFTGFGLYDKTVVDILREIGDPYPYFRGLIAEIGFDVAKIEYKQPLRKRGATKNNFYSLYDMAMVGFVNHSKLPLRFASLIGFIVSTLSLLTAMTYTLYKLFFWYSFQVGIAPLVIGIFFLGGVQLFFLGVIGEYIGSILTQVKKRPLVIEKERINFAKGKNSGAADGRAE